MFTVAANESQSDGETLDCTFEGVAISVSRVSSF